VLASLRTAGYLHGGLMNAPQLPERPDLEQLKRQAKDLLRDAKTRNGDALARFRKLPAYARQSDDAIAESAALHDAHSVIARELGFASWKELVERVEELTLEFGAAVDQFIRAATEVQPDRATRLLQLHPRIANANVYTALLLGDVRQVESHLAQRPNLVTEAGGPRDWPALLYLCHTNLRFGSATRGDGIVACARLLLERGADPNSRFPWLHHGVRRAALWGAVLVVGHLPLAEVLLAASGDDIAALELLHAHGADVNQPWATDGSATLYAIMHWSDTPDGVRWLLEHGANPDPVFATNGETPLHVAARRWDAAMVEDLVNRGADATRRRTDGRTPYAVAALSGNAEVVEWFTRHGASTELPDVDRFVAACSRGDVATADALARAHPHLRTTIGPEHYSAFYRAAERGDGRTLETMLACGFDPNHGDEDIGKTALHEASKEGRLEAVRVLLAHGASVDIRDREFHAQPLVWAAEGMRSNDADGRDYPAVGRLLLDAGSPVEWEAGEEPSESIRDVIEEWRRAASAGGAKV
jgi:ankyrin repeat protein